MGSVLILRSNDKDKFVSNGVNHTRKKYYNCNTNSIFFKALRKMNMSTMSIYYGDWKKELKNYTTVIAFDNGYNNLIGSYIKKKNPNCKLILWLWNPIIEYSKNFLASPYIDEIWTYDKEDAKKYNIKYNTQFYNKKIECPKVKIKQDITFLGMEKGRKNIINDLNKKFVQNDLTTKIHIIENEKDSISYEEYLAMVGESKAILDIIMGDVTGLTLRCMEALFFNKKLITNNSDIENYDFYNPNNIFIIGKDNLDNIKEFINKPYEPVDEKIIEYYEFEQWLKRFNLE